MSEHAVHHAETRTISIEAPPERVFALLADGRRLPEWAPAFAQAVTHRRGETWTVQTANGPVATLVRAAPAQGTVDVVSAADPTRGLFTRVLPNHAGTELVFSLVLPEGATAEQTAAQVATLDRELTAVRELVRRANG